MSHAIVGFKALNLNISNVIVPVVYSSDLPMPIPPDSQRNTRRHVVSGPVRPPQFRFLDAVEPSQICPILLETLGPGSEVAVCGNCGAIHDAAAWRESGGCAVLGCSSAPNIRRDHPSAVLRVTREDMTHGQLSPPVQTDGVSEVLPDGRIRVRFDLGKSTSLPLIMSPTMHQGPPPSPFIRTASPPPFPTISLRRNVSPPPPPPAISSNRNVNQQPPPFPSIPGIKAVSRSSVNPIRRMVAADEPTRTCPYSMEKLSTDTRVVECPKCGQILLETAWEENAGCTTYGCEGAPDFRKDAQ